VLVLFDQGTPAPLRRLLDLHTIGTAYERGWSTLTNGELLRAAEAAGFTVMVTTDANLKYQQNLNARRIAVVVLSTISWPRIRSAAALIANAIDAAGIGSYTEVRIP
jgi:hypothetical protein